MQCVLKIDACGMMKPAQLARAYIVRMHGREMPSHHYRECRCGLPPLNTRRVDGRCPFCGGSGFAYKPDVRAYACLECGGLKPEPEAP